MMKVELTKDSMINVSCSLYSVYESYKMITAITASETENIIDNAVIYLKTNSADL